ncbi:MAG: hypothetical protein QG670_172 [Thermoproteota archaeon]|nr:hypothetical protein [Thermoproteota archaeon]
MESKLNVKILRNAQVPLYHFTDYFKGFEKVDAIRRLFGEKTERVLEDLRIEFSGRRGYMGVSNVDGHLNVSAEYLNKGDILDIYLDIIHELTHVRQFMEGAELFDNRYNYVSRPTEIEAFRNAVEEARRLGLSNSRICEYLKTEWMTDEDFLFLAKTLNVKCESVPG